MIPEPATAFLLAIGVQGSQQPGNGAGHATARDGVIKAARKQKAHDDIRVLGDEVVHDEWRPIDEDEVQVTLHYAQRTLEDVYDDSDAVTQILRENGRLSLDHEARA